MFGFSVKKPYTVLVGVVLAIVLGVVSFTKMTADLLPNISLPYMLVMTAYPGASPETVEMVVTSPVESAMATVSNIESISSVSSENYSMVILEFSQSTDMNAVSLEIRESLDQIKSYWDDSVANPVMIRINPDMLPVMIAAVGVEGMDQAQVSQLVTDTIIPELESIEGVASASATGLLKESVNVIISKEKIDRINAQVYAAIDKKMADAQAEITDGKEKLEDGRKELEDGRKELSNGQTELDKGKAELDKGKEELEKKQAELATQLAEQKLQLTTAKNSLETIQNTLMVITKQQEGVVQLDAAIEGLTPVKNTTLTYLGAIARMNASLSGGDAQDTELQEQAKADIAALKNAVTNNEMLSQAAESEELAGRLDLEQLRELDWTATENIQTVTEALTMVDIAVNTIESTLKEQRTNLTASINAATSGLGYDAYTKMIEEQLKSQNITDLSKTISDIEKGLLEIEKGQLIAAIEMANGKATLNLGEYKLELAQSQLDAAKDQITSGLEQLDDAGKQLEEGQEQLDTAKEEAYDKANMVEVLTVDTIKGLLTAQNFSMPAGYVTEEGIDYLVRVGDKPDSVEELRALPLMDLHMEDVAVITLGDVADVFYTDNSDAIYTNVNGSPGVMLTIQKQTGYSTGDVSKKLLAKFDKLMKREDGLSMITLMDQGIYIDLVMNSIINNILFGALLAVIILILFLKDLRPTMVVAFSIPISLVTAIVCMYFSGVTLNVISLSGLALGIGMLVDNSIVVIENIYRLRAEGYSTMEAAIKGAKEVASAIIASTLTTVCVFLPIVFTEGITRQLFVDMGLTIAYSLFASLLVAMTVVPAMASKVLRKAKIKKEDRFFGFLVKGYMKTLEAALRHKAIVFIIVLVLLGSSIALAFSNGTAFMADMDSTQLTVSVKLDKDATLPETAALTNQVVDAIQQIEDVVDVGAMTSSSSLSLIAGGNTSSNATDVYVVTSENKTHSNEEIAAMILEKTKDLSAEITVDTSSMDMSALGGSGITIQVRGRDIDMLSKIAMDVADIVREVPGVAEVDDGLSDSGEELRITIDKDAAVTYGLTVAQVYTQIAPKLAEAKSSTVLATDSKDYNVYVTNESDVTLTRKLLEDIQIKGTDAEGNAVKIPLSEIASFAPALSLNSINRANQTRYIGVSASIKDDYNVGKVASAVESRLKSYQVPEGYQLVYSGENEMINDALSQVGLMLVLALVFMYLIMVAQFQSLLSPFIIMFTIPLAFTGGFLGLYCSGSEVSVIAMIGFVMLAGVIVNNGIVLIDYMNQLRETGIAKRDAILEAGRTRLRPVLMTALTTVLALSNMVIGKDMGSEMGRPMAVVTIGGLLYGTLLTLIVIPCIYDVFTGKWKKVTGEIEAEKIEAEK